MMKQKKAVLWGPDNLLNQALEIFLTDRGKETWKVIRPPVTGGVEEFMEQVLKIKPDLLVLYHDLPGSERTDPLMQLLEKHPAIRLIADQPNVRVVTLSLENNVVQVYSKHSITVRQVSDLLSILEDRNFSEKPTEKEENSKKTKLIRSRGIPATTAGGKF